MLKFHSNHNSFYSDDYSKTLRRQSYILSKQICLLKSALSTLHCFKIGLYRLWRTTVTAWETSSSLLKLEGGCHKCPRLRNLMAREKVGKTSTTIIRKITSLISALK